MADRPIVFSTPMVQAILRELQAPGTGKTQTRRVIQPQPEFNAISGWWHVHNKHGGVMIASEADVPSEQMDYIPYAVGDRLWVRENWRTSALYDETKPRELREGAFLHYEADGAEDKRTGVGLNGLHTYGRLRTSRFMMKWMSRLTLHLTAVRVERLQAITEADAKAEGCEIPEFRIVMARPDGGPDYRMSNSYRAAYANLMDTLHGVGTWDSDPWVAVLSFEVEKLNIGSARP